MEDRLPMDLVSRAKRAYTDHRTSRQELEGYVSDLYSALEAAEKALANYRQFLGDASDEIAQLKRAQPR